MGQSRGHTARDCAYPRYIPAEQMFSEASSPPFEFDGQAVLTIAQTIPIPSTWMAMDGYDGR